MPATTITQEEQPSEATAKAQAVATLLPSNIPESVSNFPLTPLSAARADRPMYYVIEMHLNTVP